MAAETGVGEITANNRSPSALLVTSNNGGVYGLWLSRAAAKTKPQRATAKERQIMARLCLKHVDAISGKPRKDGTMYIPCQHSITRAVPEYHHKHSSKAVIVLFNHSNGYFSIYRLPAVLPCSTCPSPSPWPSRASTCPGPLFRARSAFHVRPIVTRR